MQTVASILLLLLTVAMTVQADDFRIDLKLAPLKDHMYLFDITTGASVSAVKTALKDFTIDQSFKVIGEDRMLMTIRSNSTAQLRKLTFPSGSEVTQYPVEAMKEFLDLHGTGAGWDEDYTQKAKKNTIYTFLDWKSRLPHMLCMESLTLTFKEYATKFRKTHSILKPLVYHVMASYPPRFFYLMEVKENDLQRMLKAAAEIKGGPGSGIATTTRIVPV